MLRLAIGVLAILLVHASPVGAFTNAHFPANQAQSSGQDVSQLEAQAKSGDPIAQLKLARAYGRGDGVPQDEEVAAQWYRKAADQGNAEAQDSLGQLYLTGQGVEQNKQQAVAWFQKSARQGNASAMFHLGAAYYNGDGVDIDDSLSYAWFTLAKEAGSPRAAEAVQRAESELKPARIIRGYKKIAEVYEKGGSLPENQAEAARWWLRAAKEGDDDAQVAMATKLLNGQGVAQDFEQGRYWCHEAAKQNDASGGYCMAYMYQHGLGVSSDLKQARKWYEGAAKGGHRRAIKALAQMEENGEGGKVERPAACLLYARLASLGDQDALRSLAKLKKQIDEKEWRKLEKQMSMMRIDPWQLNLALKRIESQ
jgi:uncharacterized protein